MTLILGAIATFMAVCLSAFSVHIGAAVVDRTRAQTAADAAALAGAAEAAPGGGGQPEVIARRFAELNSARLVTCLCDAGTTAVQVEVELGGAHATARAVMDPSMLRPGSGTLVGVDPALAQAINVIIEAANGAVYVESGFRSRAEQEILWADALRRYGSAEAADDWVAPPAHSMHERGLAVDLGGDVELAARLVEQLRLPLYRPMDNEPWHFELVGSRG